MSTYPTAEPSAGRIVVGVDGSPSSEQALLWAAAQGRLTGQEVHAIITWRLPMAYDGSITADADWVGQAAGTLQKTVENVLGSNDAPPVVQHVSRGPAAKVLVEETADPADLLVVGSRGHGGFTGLALGSVSQHVVAQAACPVVVVHGDRAPTSVILVGVDGSPESEQALRWAARQARLAGCSLQVLHVWEVPFRSGVLFHPAPDRGAQAERTLAAAVSAALDEEDLAAVQQEVVEGAPADVLLRRAVDADLLVLGSRGRGGFAGLLLGSVSLHLAAHAPCPVVVLHGTTTRTDGP